MKLGGLCQWKTGWDKTSDTCVQGVVSLTHKLFKIILQKYTMLEILFIVRI